MARCIFEGLTSKQAEVLAHWFEGQGEQNCEIWFEDRKIKSPITDVGRLDKHGNFTGYKETLDNGDVIVYCRTPGENHEQS